MKKPSKFLVALCRAHLLAPEGSAEEDVLTALVETVSDEEGVDRDALQDEQSDALRAEGLLPDDGRGGSKEEEG